jgi:ABC-type Na+ efflux pump permease subunit
VTVQSADPALAAAAGRALRQAAGVEGRRYAVSAQGAAPRLRLVRTSQSGAEAQFDAAFPLSPAGRALVLRTLERDAAADRLSQVPGGGPAETVRQLPPRASAPSGAPGPGRLVLVMMLWLTLTGSLGMLLQAVVRERANRALECLLAAARPWQIVFGKLAGVGGVSFLVLASWVGSAALAGLAAPRLSGPAAGLFAELARPQLLAQAAGIYLLAFAFYGLVTVAVGAAARDSASAQNCSRPMFAVLLAAFFATLAAAGGTARLSWLVFAPPFAPFMLLLKAPAPAAALTATGLLAAAAAVAGWIAVRGLHLGAAEPLWRVRASSPLSWRRRPSPG